MTMKGGSSRYVTPSTVTCRSSMHSSSAACVLGEARLTSSTRRRFANTGPGRNSNSLVCWLKTLTPVTSDGRRSGVNWRREKLQSSERASALASIVLPTPGKSSTIAWPSATRQRTTRRSVSSGAWMTRPRFLVTSRIRSEGLGATARSAKARLDLVEDRPRDLVLRRLGDRPLGRGRDQRHLVLCSVEADVGPPHIVEDDEIGALVGELLPCALEAVLSGLGGEADEELALAATLAQRREHVGRGFQLERPRRGVLRPLRREGLRGPVVSDSRCHHDDVGLRGHGEVGGEQGHLGTAPVCLGRDRDSHSPRGAVADEADRVDRLAGATRGDEDALAAQPAITR